MAKHQTFIMRHTDHKDDQILTETGLQQCSTTSLKILEFLQKNKIGKCIFIYDDLYYRTKATAEILHAILQEEANVETSIFSTKDSIKQLLLLGVFLDDFLDEVSPTTATLVIIIGSCEDMPNLFKIIDILSEPCTGSDMERILGHTNFFHLEELEKFKSKFTLEEIKAFVH
jgi:hypothetical protein